MQLRSTIAKSLTTYRSAAKLSQREVAERAGVSLDTVQRCEAEEDSPRARSPSVDVLGRMAEALGVSPASLVSSPAEGAELHARALVMAVGLAEALRVLAEVAEDVVPSIVRK